MSKKSFNPWLHLVAEIQLSKKVICPICNMPSIEYIYVGNKETRIGFLRLWCKDCLKGIHVSRVLIPENAKMIDFDENPHLPEFKQITP